MWDKAKAVEYLNNHAQPGSLGRCAEYVRRAIEAGGVALTRHQSAKDYGPSLTAVGFLEIVSGHADASYQHQAGDVGIIQPIAHQPDGHMTMFNGSNWVSDFVQNHGIYPGPSYRSAQPAYAIYRYPS